MLKCAHTRRAYCGGQWPGRLLLPSLLLASALLAHGCSILPGQRMAPQGDVSESALPVQADGEAVTLEHVAIMPIDGELLVQQAQAVPPAAVLPVELTRPVPEPYRVGPQDVLSIVVWEHPELTIPAGEFRSAESAGSGHLVRDDGTLYYPYVGVVHVAGRTVEQIRTELTASLARVIKDPQLDVRVAAYRSKRVYVVGEVAAPGVQAIDDVPMTVAEAINRAGGLGAQADLTRLLLTRAGQVHVIDLLGLYHRGEVAQNVLLRNGDVLNIPNRDESKIFVLGEVAQPGSQLLIKGRKSLAEALADAQGVKQETAAAGRVYVMRAGRDRPQIFHLDTHTAEGLILADRFALQARDVVYVDTTDLVRFNRVVSQILPTAQLLQALSFIEFPLFRGVQ